MVNEKGIDGLQAGNIISIYGIGFAFGGVIFGTAMKYWKNSALFLEILCMISFSGICVSYVYCYRYITLASLSLLFGAFRSAMATVRPVSLVDMFGIGSLNIAYSMVMLVSGFATIFGPPIIGAFRVTFGTYDYPYFITSGIFFIGGVSIFCVACIHWKDKVAFRLHNQYMHNINKCAENAGFTQNMPKKPSTKITTPIILTII